MEEPLLTPEPPPEPLSTPAVGFPLPSFGIWKSLFLLAAYFAIQATIGVLVIAAFVIFGMINGTFRNEAAFINRITYQSMPWIMLLATAGSALGAVALTWLLGRPFIRQPGPRGFGWQRATSRQLITAASTGLLFGLFWQTIVHSFPPRARDFGPMVKILQHSDAARLVWIFLAVLLAPLFEEFFFRGVLLAGITRSWGLTAGVTISTLLFVSMHLAETWHYWPATLAITCLAVALVAFRMHTGVLGPSIALHCAYNSVLALSLVLTANS